MSVNFPVLAVVCCVVLITPCRLLPHVTPLSLCISQVLRLQRLQSPLSLGNPRLASSVCLQLPHPG